MASAVGETDGAGDPTGRAVGDGGAGSVTVEADGLPPLLEQAATITALTMSDARRALTRRVGTVPSL